ncbi:MAG: hypothetical protein JWO23_1149, partial [Solirubrobacterales bacterium]|nr:hypothetical protein [Solirubrobacterales bacterium]
MLLEQIFAVEVVSPEGFLGH